MSKTFDEGGAKGLLLANLAVGSGGCKIIFDSSLDDVEDNDCTAQEDNNVGSDESTPVDVTTLTTKLSSLVAASGQSIEDLPLVPQLASLRHEFATLQKDGFVDNQVIAVSALICGVIF
jgi:condensin complex subunit 2